MIENCQWVLLCLRIYCIELQIQILSRTLICKIISSLYIICNNALRKLICMFVEKSTVSLKLHSESIYMVKFNIADLEEKWSRPLSKIHIAIPKIALELQLEKCYRSVFYLLYFSTTQVIFFNRFTMMNLYRVEAQ